MRLDQATFSLSVATLAIFTAWVCLTFCVRLAKRCTRRFQLQQLRRQGRTVPNDRMNSEAGFVLSLDTTPNRNSVRYWWIPTTSSLSAEEVLDKWVAGEAFAFDQQQEIEQQVLANSVPTRIVRFREVSRFNIR